MSKFTGGEWKYLQWPFIGLGGDEQWCLIGSPERAIGFIRHEEDAKLITAAPKMYELLIFAMASLRDGDIPAQRVADRIEELLARIDNEEDEHE